MQFPISREGLQNFNREAAYEQKQKEQRYDFYRGLIQNICKDIENGMMPFQILPPNSLDYIRYEAMLRDKQYIWKDIEILSYWKVCINPHSHMEKYINHHSQMQKYSSVTQCYKNGTLRNNCHKSTEDFNQSLPEFIEMLKQTFIGCDIIVDPLKTYLIIDWS